MSLNKCMIIGNLGRDPEMRYTPSGQAVTQFTVAANRRWQTNGEWQEETEWFRVVVWGQQAERTAERLRKGHKVYVEGRIQTRQWEDQTGNKRYTTELVANQVTSLERRERDEDAPFPEDRPSGPSGSASGGSSRSAGGAPAGGAPAGATPAGGTPAGGSPAGGTPAGGSPTGGSPAGGSPAGGGEDEFDDLPF